MRRFEVWIDRGMQAEPYLTVVDFPDGTPDAECEKRCKECLDEMMAELDTGWRELARGEVSRGSKQRG